MRQAPLMFRPALPARRSSRREATPSPKHLPQLHVAPPLTQGLFRPRPLSVAPPQKGADSANNNSAPPSAEKPVPIKEYAYVSPPYVDLRHQCTARRRDFLSLIQTASGRSRKRQDPGQNRGYQPLPRPLRKGASCGSDK
ncbi:hypothetical protein VULLAG_LOCUS2103 [Vulpes lagopus]